MEQNNSSTNSLTSALDGGGWSTSRTVHFTLGKETRYPLYRRLDGPQCRSGQVRKISPPTGTRTLDRPAPNQSPHRLSYPGPRKVRHIIQKCSFVIYRTLQEIIAFYLITTTEVTHPKDNFNKHPPTQDISKGSHFFKNTRPLDAKCY